MVLVVELSKSQMPRPLPSPTFSAPFAVPSLRWACKKRLRCFRPYDAAAAAIHLSPSLDSHRPPTLQCDGGTPMERAPAMASSSPSPPAPSDRRRNPIQVPALRREGEPPDLSSGAGEGGEPGPRGDEVGWSLRSRRGRGGDEEMRGSTTTKKKKNRKVELWVSLPRDEIEEDFLRMVGTKPPRRPRRGGRAACNNLISGIFPGSCLPISIAADRYKVSEPWDSRKR